MSEDFYKKRIAELIAKADEEQVRKIYYLFLGMMRGAVHGRD